MAIRYTVIGKGHFPVDMLRYDQCWPVWTADAMSIYPPTLSERDDNFWTTERRIKLMGDIKPTIERWNSFGWRVEGVEV